jgi:hypothetical protein
MTVKTTFEVAGIKDVLREINDIDKKARRQITKQFKAITAPVVEEAKNNVPQMPPISGWGRKWQTKSGFQMLPWQSYNAAKLIDTKVSGKRPRQFAGMTRDLAVLYIRWRGMVNTVFDTASNWETTRGENMVRGLTDKHGPASRVMWPAYENNANEIENALREQIEKVMLMVNRKINQDTI